MARRRDYGGRPSKGDRGHIVTRPPLAVDEAVRDAADAAGLSISDYVANVLAEKLGLPLVAPTATGQQKLIA